MNLTLTPLLHKLEELRVKASLSQSYHGFLMEATVGLNNEISVRILDRSNTLTPEPKVPLDELLGRTFIYQREQLNAEGELKFIENHDHETIAFICEDPQINGYTFTEVRGKTGAYSGVDLITHATGVVASHSGLEIDHVRTTGRALTRELQSDPKLRPFNFKGVARLLHNFHKRCNVNRDEYGKLSWTAPTKFRYMKFILNEPHLGTGHDTLQNLLGISGLDH